MGVQLDIGPAAAALFAQAVQAAQGPRPAEAVDLLVGGLRLAPGFAAGYVSLATLLRQFGQLEQALPMAQAALALAPEDAAATVCLAAILHDSADFAGAAALYGRFLRRMPEHAGVLSSLGSSLQAMGRLAEALPLHARAVAAAPHSADAHYNYADALLAAGDLAAGWEEYEWRWRRAHARPRGFGAAWAGEDLTGRTILLHAEQGFGDTLQFVRYAPMAAARGARVVLEVQPALARLLASLPGVAQIVAQGAPLPPFDAHCPLLSLPRAFATRLDTVPAAIPYLRADPALRAEWEARLPDDGALRVGLAWAGSAHPTASGLSVFDRRRSLPLTALAPLGGIPDVRFVSLQTGPQAAQMQAAPPGLPVLDFTAALTDFAETAALIAALDLVIAVDTAVAHLAGALGRPVWLLSRSDGCWRWLDGRDDSPWYPTLRLYRQAQPLAWQAVTARVSADLAVMARLHRG